MDPSNNALCRDLAHGSISYIESLIQSTGLWPRPTGRSVNPVRNSAHQTDGRRSRCAAIGDWTIFISKHGDGSFNAAEQFG
jgi:hypothetical protein